VLSIWSDVSVPAVVLQTDTIQHHQMYAHKVLYDTDTDEFNASVNTDELKKHVNTVERLAVSLLFTAGFINFCLSGLNK